MEKEARRNKLFEIDGLRFCLTGGGGHLGGAIALQAAALGARVLICGRNEEMLRQVQEKAVKSNYPGSIMARKADIGSAVAVEELFDLMQKEWKGCDGWVNNASASKMSSLLNLNREAVEDTLKSDLVNAMMATDTVAKKSIELGNKISIVNISSMYGLVSPQPSTYNQHPQYHNPPAYGAAKAGIIQFTRYAACHLGLHGIRVNSISPGPFPKDKIRAEDGFLRELEKRVPLNRVGNAEEIAGPVLFLLSDASSFITGHNLVVDGGWTAW